MSGEPRYLYLIGEEGGKELAGLGGNGGKGVFKTNGDGKELETALGVCVGSQKENNCVEGEGYELRLVSDEGWEKDIDKEELENVFKDWNVKEQKEEESKDLKVKNEEIGISGWINSGGLEGVARMMKDIKANALHYGIYKTGGNLKNLKDHLEKHFGKIDCLENWKNEGKLLEDFLKRNPGKKCNYSLYDFLSNDGLGSLGKEESSEERLAGLLGVIGLWNNTGNFKTSELNRLQEWLKEKLKLKKVNKKFKTIDLLTYQSTGGEEEKIEKLTLHPEAKLKKLKLHGNKEGNSRKVSVEWKDNSVEFKVGDNTIYTHNGDQNIDKEKVSKHMNKYGIGRNYLDIFSEDNQNNNNFWSLLALLVLIAFSQQGSETINFELEIEINSGNSKTIFQTSSGTKNNYSYLRY